MPRRADRTQLVIPASQVLLTSAQMPRAARRRAASALAYAVEENTLGDPEANRVSWIGAAGESDALAVVDRQGLERWLAALAAIGLRSYEVHCETLMLPWTAGQWSIAWDGGEGFVRVGPFEGSATDCGDRRSPPLSLRMALEAADAKQARPGAVVVYPRSADAAPDAHAWRDQLGVDVRVASQWDWRSAPEDAGVKLFEERGLWPAIPGALARLRPAAWIAAIALALHAVALVSDWAVLAGQQRGLRRQMETRFRAAFPDAVAVVDPALQMRRKLADARHSAGRVDGGDFLPMIEKVAAAAKEIPAASLRVGSYESGRMTLELAGIDEAGARRLAARLVDAGFEVDMPAPAARPGGGGVVITVRAS